jgi:hypothetical protein
MVSKCVTSISFPNLLNLHFFLHFLIFLKLFVSHIVSHCVTVWQIHRCHFCETRPTCHKYQYHVTLVIKCVKECVLVIDFNKVLGGGEKSDSKAFGDYFVVSRRQKSIGALPFTSD